MTYHVKTKGVKQARNKVAMVAKAMDMEKMNHAAAIFLDRWVQSNFKTQGDNVGGWEPFMYGGRLTAKKRGGVPGTDGRYVNPSAKLMLDSGDLRKSFKPFYDRKTAGIGSDLPYAKRHDQGEDGSIQRRLLPEDKEVAVELKKLYGKKVRTALNA